MNDNFWHKKFNQDNYLYGKNANDFLRKNFHYLPAGGNVLSLGEGEGRNAVFLAEQGYQVTAVDAAASGLNKVKKLAAERGVADKVTTQLVDLEDYEMAPQHWDGIINVFCHLPPTLRQQVHTQIVKGLKPNGVFLLEAYTPAQLAFKTGGPRNKDLLYTVDILQNELAELEIVKLEEVQRDIQEGEAHKGMSAVAQLVARKHP